MDKFCVNCKHSIRFSSEVYKCKVVYGVDLVTGSKEYLTCKDARNVKSDDLTYQYSNYCGPYGNCFEKAA